MRILVVMFILMLTVACTPLPQTIKKAPQPDVQFSDVQKNADQYIGKTVRWGGQVVSVDNDAQGATILVSQFKLNSFGRPKVDKTSTVYFLVRTKTRLDPKLYDADTLITVVGTVAGNKSIPVHNEQSMTFPLVEASQVYRWPYKVYIEDYDSPNYRDFYNRFYALPPYDKPWWR